LIQVVLGHGGRSDEAKARRRARMDANMARRKGDARPVLSRVGRSRPWREMKKPRPRSDRGELANRGTGWPGPAQTIAASPTSVSPGACKARPRAR
jgi:hypothetical protein